MDSCRGERGGGVRTYSPEVDPLTQALKLIPLPNLVRMVALWPFRNVPFVGHTIPIHARAEEERQLIQT